MASGTLGQSAPSAATYTTVYTVPGGTTATVNVNFVNRGATAGLVRLAVAASSTPANAEFIEYDININSSQVLERSGIVMSAGKLLVVYCSTANFSVNVHGFES